MNRTDGMGRLHELREKIDAVRRDRIEFLAKLRRTVAGLRKIMMDENRAAHTAWFGPTLAEQANAARIIEAAIAARIKEEAATRIKEEAATRIKEEAAARIKEAAKDALKKAATEAIHIKEAAKNALVKATAKTTPLKATTKPAKKVRGR
jgi:replicative DNA helicase